jgi:hypothetical protein
VSAFDQDVTNITKQRLGSWIATLPILLPVDFVPERNLCRILTTVSSDLVPPFRQLINDDRLRDGPHGNHTLGSARRYSLSRDIRLRFLLRRDKKP